MNRIFRRGSAIISAVAVFVTPVAAVAKTPGSVADLVGARAAGGEEQLEFRGFHQISSHTQDYSKISYWWNGNTKECVRVDTSDGKYSAIRETTKADCNKKGGDGDKAAVAVAGAAAILGIVALASKSHHRGDANYDERGTAEFERGHRDGLYNHAYHNYSRDDAYSRGFESGVREREQQSSYRGGNYYGGGYSPSVQFYDLQGRERKYAVNQMVSRGFMVRDNKKTDDGRYITFWREASRQCAVLNSSNGYVVSLENVSANICRD